MDELDWLTPRFERAGCFGEGSTHDAAALNTLEVLQSLVAGMQDDKHHYVVSWAPIKTAATDITGHNVVVGSRPMTQKSLSNGQRAAILVGEMYHEVGHIRYGRHLTPTELQRAFGAGNKPAADLSNIAEDVRIERKLIVDLPGFSEALPIALKWVGNEGKPYNPILQPFRLNTPEQRLAEGVGAVRFPWLRNWEANSSLRDWADWWQQWAERAAKAHTLGSHVTVVNEALAKINAPPPSTEPEDGDGEPTKGEPGEGEPNGKGKGKGDSTEGEGETDDGDSDTEGEGKDESDGDGRGAGESTTQSKASGKGGNRDPNVDPNPTEQSPVPTACVSEAAKGDTDLMMQMGADMERVNRTKRGRERTYTFRANHDEETRRLFRRANTPLPETFTEEAVRIEPGKGRE